MLPRIKRNLERKSLGLFFEKYLLLLKNPRAITAKTMTMSEIGNGNSLEMINAIPK